MKDGFKHYDEWLQDDSPRRLRRRNKNNMSEDQYFDMKIMEELNNEGQTDFDC